MGDRRITGGQKEEDVSMPQRILAVDDEANVRRIVQVILTRAGYQVTLAGDGVEGLGKVKEELPDLVVLDVMMPHMDGFEMLRRLKSDPEIAGIKVIMLTARAQDADIFEGERMGADLYLTKPFNPNDLLQAVNQLLAPG